MVDLTPEQKTNLDKIISNADNADALILAVGTQDGDDFKMQTALVGNLSDLEALLIANLDHLKKSAMELISGEDIDELAEEFTEFMKAKGKNIKLPPQKTKVRVNEEVDEDVGVSYR